MIRFAPSLVALRRRLDAQALSQLRTVAAQQADTIERQRAEIERLEGACKDWELCADIWREDALDYLTQLAEAEGRRVGLTPCGQFLMIPDQQVPA